MWLTLRVVDLSFNLVYIDLVVVSLEMVFVIRDATLHSVSLMEEIVDLKDDELSAPQYYSMCVCNSHLYACAVAMYTRYCVCLFIPSNVPMF